MRLGVLPYFSSNLACGGASFWTQISTQARNVFPSHRTKLAEERSETCIIERLVGRPDEFNSTER
jgi:hypothetical protein